MAENVHTHITTEIMAAAVGVAEKQRHSWKKPSPLHACMLTALMPLDIWRTSPLPMSISSLMCAEKKTKQK
jgi:hypothetical protein